MAVCTHISIYAYSYASSCIRLSILVYKYPSEFELSIFLHKTISSSIYVSIYVIFLI